MHHDTTSVGPRLLSRRLLISAAASTGAVAFWSRPSASLAATPSNSGSLTLREVDGDEATFFDAPFARSLAVPYPRTLSLDGSRSNSATATVDVSLDPRGFAASSFMVISGGSDFTVADVRRTASGCCSTFSLPRGAGPVLLHLPVIPGARYPHENIGAVAPIRVRVRLEDGRVATFSSAAAPASLAATVAGAELGVAWTSVTVRDRGGKADYRVPSVITCASVGPQPLPAGSTISLSVDARLAAVPRLQSATIDGRPTTLAVTSSHQDPESRVLSLTTSEPVPAQSILETRLSSPTEMRSTPTVEGVLFSRVQFELPASSSVILRDSGKTTVADLSPSGEPLLPRIAVGTI